MRPVQRSNNYYDCSLWFLLLLAVSFGIAISSISSLLSTVSTRIGRSDNSDDRTRTTTQLRGLRTRGSFSFGISDNVYENTIGREGTVEITLLLNDVNIATSNNANSENYYTYNPSYHGNVGNGYLGSPIVPNEVHKANLMLPPNDFIDTNLCRYNDNPTAPIPIATSEEDYSAASASNNSNSSANNTILDSNNYDNNSASTNHTNTTDGSVRSNSTHENTPDNNFESDDLPIALLLNYDGLCSIEEIGTAVLQFQQSLFNSKTHDNFIIRYIIFYSDYNMPTSSTPIITPSLSSEAEQLAAANPASGSELFETLYAEDFNDSLADPLLATGSNNNNTNENSSSEEFPSRELDLFHIVSISAIDGLNIKLRMKNLSIITHTSPYLFPFADADENNNDDLPQDNLDWNMPIQIQRRFTSSAIPTQPSTTNSGSGSPSSNHNFVSYPGFGNRPGDYGYENTSGSSSSSNNIRDKIPYATENSHTASGSGEGEDDSDIFNNNGGTYSGTYSGSYSGSGGTVYPQDVDDYYEQNRYNARRGHDFYWFRFVLFSLLVFSPCLRAGYLWYLGGGRIRFLYNENGTRIMSVQYIPPDPYWYSPFQQQQHEHEHDHLSEYDRQRDLFMSGSNHNIDIYGFLSARNSTAAANNDGRPTNPLCGDHTACLTQSQVLALPLITYQQEQPIAKPNPVTADAGVRNSAGGSPVSTDSACVAGAAGPSASSDVAASDGAIDFTGTNSSVTAARTSETSDVIVSSDNDANISDQQNINNSLDNTDNDNLLNNNACSISYNEIRNDDDRSQLPNVNYILNDETDVDNRDDNSVDNQDSYRNQPHSRNDEFHDETGTGSCISSDIISDGFSDEASISDDGNGDDDINRSNNSLSSLRHSISSLASSLRHSNNNITAAFALSLARPQSPDNQIVTKEATNTQSNTNSTGGNNNNNSNISKGNMIIHETCPICIDDFENGEEIRMLPLCQHTFHTECIIPWLTQRQGCCPLCKTPVIANSNSNSNSNSSSSTTDSSISNR